jgi:hypothetical protein
MKKKKKKSENSYYKEKYKTRLKISLVLLIIYIIQNIFILSYQSEIPNGYLISIIIWDIWFLGVILFLFYNTLVYLKRSKT